MLKWLFFKKTLSDITINVSVDADIALQIKKLEQLGMEPRLIVLGADVVKNSTIATCKFADDLCYYSSKNGTLKKESYTLKVLIEPKISGIFIF